MNAITNDERIQNRIRRDKERRRQKRENKFSGYDNLDKVFTVQHYVKALKNCNKGVMWKSSVQEYNSTPITRIMKSAGGILAGKIPRIANTKDVLIRERGKERKITPIAITDRMYQKVLCDESLLPLVKDSLIYDNGASLPGKGVEFERKRIEKHLRAAMREYGSNFYVLTFDFKSYFDSIPHSTCYNVLSSVYRDRRMVNLAMGIIKSHFLCRINKIGDRVKKRRLLSQLDSNEMFGICLGSQVSQIMALVVPNKLDHYIKDTCRMRHYVRYMDDGAILAKDKETLHRLLNGMKKVCAELGLTLHPKKTRIVKSTRGFVFLKRKYRVAGERLIICLTRSGIVRMRRKLRKFVRLVESGKMSLDDVYNSFQSWLAHSKGAMSYNTTQSMLRLYNKLFNGYKVTKKYNHIKEAGSNEILQVDRWAEYRWGRNVA